MSLQRRQGLLSSAPSLGGLLPTQLGYIPSSSLARLASLTAAAIIQLSSTLIVELGVAFPTACKSPTAWAEGHELCIDVPIGLFCT